MALDFFPPAVLALLVDSKEFNAKMDESMGKLDAFAARADSAGARLNNFANKASTAVLGVGVALGTYAVDQAYKFQEGLDKIMNQSGLSAGQTNKLGDAILRISAMTGIMTPDLLSAGLAMAQAGIKGGAASNMLEAAAKAAVVTGQSATTITQSLIAVENLHIAAGMNVAKITGLMVAGSHDFQGGMAGVAALLQGKVGVALANYNVGMKSAIEMGAQFSQVGLPTRSISSFVNGMGKVFAPLMTVHTTAKRTYETLSTYAQKLQQVGLSQTKLAADLRTGNVPGFLLQIKDAAAAAHAPLAEFMNLVLGSTGGGVGSLLSKDLPQMLKTLESLKGAGGGSLNTAFGKAIKQLGPELHKVEAEFNTMMIKLGRAILPDVAKTEHWLASLPAYFKSHPLVTEIATKGAIDLFAAALTYKVATALKNAVGGLINFFKTGTADKNLSTATGQLEYLQQIAANTAKMAGLQATADEELLAGGGAKGALGMGLTFSKAVGVFAAGVIAFEATTQFLKTSFGKKAGNWAVDNNFFGVGTLANSVADLVGARAHPKAAANQQTMDFMKSIGALKDYQKMLFDDATANYKGVTQMAQAIADKERQYARRQPSRAQLGAARTRTTVIVRVTR